MIRAKPLSLAQKLKNIVDICEAADAAIDEQNLIKKGALDTGKENDGIEPAVVRKILARRKKIAKDPAETTRLEDLMTDYQFMLGEGREDTRPWTQADDEISRVMALTNTSKPPKIEAIKKALGCSQGKAHKLRSIVAVRLAKKSSSSSTPREHEHLNKPEDGDDGITRLSGRDAPSDEHSEDGHGGDISDAGRIPVQVVAEGPRDGVGDAGEARRDAEEPRTDSGDSEAPARVGGEAGPEVPQAPELQNLPPVAPGPQDTLAERRPDSLKAENAQPATLKANETNDRHADSHAKPATPAEPRPPIADTWPEMPGFLKRERVSA